MLRFLFTVFLFLNCTASFSSSLPKSVDVLIVGAGLSGLATAYELKKLGIEYHIVELTARAGGRVKTTVYRRPQETDLVADSGMEEYWESNPAVHVLKELKLPVRSDSPISSLQILGKLESFNEGESAEEFIKRIFSKSELESFKQFQKKIEPWVKSLHENGVVPQEIKKLKDISLEAWMLQLKLPKKVSEWFRISIECEIGTVWSKISALDGLAEMHIFAGAGETSYRVIGGNEKFIEALVKSIGSSNLSLEHRVTKVFQNKEYAEVSVIDQKTMEQKKIRAKYVVNTIPLFRLFEVQFEPELNSKKKEAIQSQTHGSYFKAHVFVSKEATEKYWARGEKKESILPILSDSPLGVIYDGNPDQDTKTKILSLLVTGPMADAFNFMPLDNVRAILKESFEKFWPGFSSLIQDIEFYRLHPKAIAAWPPGRSRFDELSQEIRKPEGRIYFAGDFTESSHSDGAFRSAKRVAAQIGILEKKRSSKDVSLDMVNPGVNGLSVVRDRSRSGKKVDL